MSAERLTNRVVHIFILAVFTVPVNVFAGWNMLLSEETMQECIIENMRGVQNDAVAKEIVEKCMKFPKRTTPYSSSGFFGSRTASNCVMKNAQDIRSEYGSKILRAACYQTYPRE
jgi:hypothetical protein